MKRQRVLYVNHAAALGGGEIALANLIGQLDRSKVEPLLVLFSDGPLRERVDELLPVTVLTLPARILTARKDTLGVAVLARIVDIAACVVFTAKLAKVIRRMRVDIVHTNSLKADLLGGVAARLAGVPVIWHVRDRISPDYLPALVVKIFRLLARLIPAHVIANSAATMSTLVTPSRAHAFEARCAVVHDGVVERSFAPVAPIERESIVFGIVGRISPWKGQDVFLRAAAKVREECPAAIFRVIGAPLFGEEEYERSVHALCTSLGLASNVEFTGFIGAIDDAIEKLDVLVHASVLAEPFGQVIIEGMAAGKPVIATRGGGVLEIVVDQVTGLLVPMNDVDAMAKAMMRLHASAEERRAMGSRGKERVREHFGMEDVARKVQGIYETIGAVKLAETAAPGGLKVVTLPISGDN